MCVICAYTVDTTCPRVELDGARYSGLESSRLGPVDVSLRRLPGDPSSQRTGRDSYPSIQLRQPTKASVLLHICYEPAWWHVLCSMHKFDRSLPHPSLLARI